VDMAASWPLGRGCLSPVVGLWAERAGRGVTGCQETGLAGLCPQAREGQAGLSPVPTGDRSGSLQSCAARRRMLWTLWCSGKGRHTGACQEGGEGEARGEREGGGEEEWEGGGKGGGVWRGVWGQL